MGRRRLLFMLPLAIFGLVAAYFVVGLDPDRNPARLRRTSLLRALALAVPLPAGCAHGGRPAAHEIVWEGSVTVREDVLVAPGETLVVRPGTRVSFAFRDDDGDGAGDARVLVRGAIDACGSAAAPIAFVPERPGAAGAPGWGEILIEDAEGARFAECRFSGAQQALHDHRTPLIVERSRFAGNAIGVRFTGGPVSVHASAFPILRAW